MPELSDQMVLKHAFLDQHNLILLGGTVLFSAALMSPVPAMASAGAELIWLLASTSSQAFRRRVASRELRRSQQRFTADIEQAASRLSTSASPRVRSVGEALVDVCRLASESTFDESLGPQGAKKVLALLEGFAKVARSHDRLSQLVGNGPAAMKEEIARLSQAVTNEQDGTVRITLRQSLSLNQRRLKQLEEVESARRALGIKMTTVETLLGHVQSQVATNVAAEEVALGLDDLLTAVKYNPQVEREASRALDSGRLTMIVEAVQTAR